MLSILADFVASLLHICLWTLLLHQILDHAMYYKDEGNSEFHLFETKFLIVVVVNDVSWSNTR